MGIVGVHVPMHGVFTNIETYRLKRSIIANNAVIVIPLPEFCLSIKVMFFDPTQTSRCGQRFPGADDVTQCELCSL